MTTFFDPSTSLRKVPPSQPPAQALVLIQTGDDGLTEYTARATKSKTTPDSNPHEWKDNRLRVYFPSEQTVKETYGGPNSAGTICFQSSWFNGPKFPSSILRDCASARKGLLMHNKVSTYSSGLNGKMLMDKCRSCTYGQTSGYRNSIATPPAAAHVRHGHTSEVPIYQRVPGTSPSHNPINL